MRIPIAVFRVTPVLLCLLLVGCASGLGSYQRGNYYKACDEAVKKLRGNPTNEDSRAALTQAYPLAVANAQRDIENLKSANNLNSLESILVVYDQMNKLADDINHCPAALALVPNPATYYNERSAVAETAARIAYDAGVLALNEGTLEKSREALEYFVRTDNYINSYKDVSSKIDQARYAATLRLIVLRPQLSSKYQLSGDFFYNQLMADITKRTYKYLVRFYTPEEAAAEGMGTPHNILELDFTDFAVGNTREISNTTELSRSDASAGAATGTAATVKAKFTTSRIEILSEGVLAMRMRDASTGRVLQQKAFPGKYAWFSEWATFNGDERALDKDQLALTKKRRQTPPAAQDMFVSFAGPLYAEVSRTIVAIYSGR